MGSLKEIFTRNRPWRLVLTAVMLATPIAFAARNEWTDDLSDLSYIVPLGNSVYLQRLGLEDSDRRSFGCGEFQIREAKGVDFKSCDGLSALDAEIWNVEKLAAVSGRIVGKAREGYFIYPKVFGIQEDYESALAATGISDAGMVVPGKMAATLPARTIWPWAFAFMDQTALIVGYAVLGFCAAAYMEGNFYGGVPNLAVALFYTAICATAVLWEKFARWLISPNSSLNFSDGLPSQPIGAV
jgi:hypothetical protein